MTSVSGRGADDALLTSTARVFASHLEETTRASGGRTEWWNDTLICDARSPHRYRNLVVPLRPLRSDEADDLGERAAGFYGRTDSWFVASMFQLDPGARRLIVDLTEDLMVHPGGPDHPDAAAPVKILEVATPEDMEEFENVWARAYEKPHPLEPGAVRNDERVLIDGHRLWLGFIDGRAVATGGSYRRFGLNLIRAITTLHAYRGRGIGSAMTLQAMAASDDARVLNAEVGAERVYGRLGFRSFSAFQFWRHADSEATSNGRIPALDA